MLYAISGSQGCGKSTVLNELEERGFSVVKRKSARSILDEWGVSLNDVNNDHDLTIKFQNEITSRKWEDEHTAADIPDVWFTERTHADLFVYALIDLGRNNDYSKWLNEYYKKCLHHCQMYAGVYYLRAGKFQVENDGVRGSNHHYSRMVDLTMLDITRQMLNPSKVYMLDTSDLEQRVDIIEMQCNSVFNRNR